MQSNNLQIAPQGVRPVVHASQFDDGRQIKFKLYDGSTAYTPPVGATINVEGIKPDNHGFSYACTWSGNEVTFALTQQMTVIAGTVNCELRILDGDDSNIGTLNFILDVESSPINENTIISDTELPVVIALATAQVEEAEAWAVGTKDGTPVTSDDPQYNNSAKYWANQVGGQTQGAEAWAVGTKDGVPVTSDDPQYHNNSKYYAEQASTAASGVDAYALKAEGYAIGKQNGTPVSSGSPYYHNNAEYYAGQASSSATAADSAADRAEAAVINEPYIGANGNWFVYDFSTQAYVDTNVDATGPAGADGEDGAPGATGNGIASITKTGTSGLVDTYTILFTDGTSTTFTVTNGANGTGSGDMMSADYDPNSTVKNDGGIVAYVADQLSGFSTNLSGLSDVDLTNLSAGQTLTYDSVNQKWVNTSLATVATSGSYNDLSNKPSLATVATSGAYSDLSGTPTLATVATSGAYSDLSGTPTLATVATSGDYGDLLNKPTLGTAAAKASTNAVTQSSTDLVESGAVYTEINSLNSALSNKADNSKAYQTDDTTETVLASDDVLPFYDTSATAKRKMTVQKFGEQLISNPNLLDNPWFTVNQRGANSFTGGNSWEYGFVDRWMCRNLTASLNNDGSVSLAYSGSGVQSFLQKMDSELANKLVGKVCTISFLFGDDSIVSKSFKFPAVNTTTNIFLDNIHELFCVYVGNAGFDLRNNKGEAQTITIKAMKLELGTVSTLAMDTAPNYATELLKCQRYFVRHTFNTSSGFNYMDAYNTSNANMLFPLPTSMRTTPTMAISDITRLRVGSVVSGGLARALTASDSFSLTSSSSNWIVYPKLKVNDSGFTAGSRYYVALINADSPAYADFSADL